MQATESHPRLFFVFRSPQAFSLSWLPQQPVWSYTEVDFWGSFPKVKGNQMHASLTLSSKGDISSQLDLSWYRTVLTRRRKGWRQWSESTLLTCFKVVFLLSWVLQLLNWSPEFSRRYFDSNVIVLCVFMWRDSGWDFLILPSYWCYSSVYFNILKIDAQKSTFLEKHNHKFTNATSKNHSLREER